MQIQQGDVVLEQVDDLPMGVKLKKAGKRGLVLMEGEATGHFHSIAETNPDICELYEVEGVLYVKASQPVKLTHQEHNTLTLEPGIWKVGQVKEFDYLQNMIRSVVD